MTPQTCRAAVAHDVDAMLAIYTPVVRETAISFEVEPPSSEEFAHRLATITSTHAWLVAEIDGAVAGYAYGSPHRARAAYRWSTDVTVYVAEWARGRRVGRALYDDLLPRLAGLGYVSAFAGITLPNEPSVALHESVGFTPVGVYSSVGFKLGRWHDVGWWGRRLGDLPDIPADVPKRVTP